MNLDKQKILITGGTTGIGAALVAQLQNHGARVITCARHLPEQPLPGVIYRRCDLAIPAERAALIAWIQDEHPDTAVLINNAALQSPLDFLHDTPQHLQATLAQELALNLEAPIALAAGLLPLLAQHPRGAIINITTRYKKSSRRSSPLA